MQIYCCVWCSQLYRTRCVNPCQPAFIRVEISIQRRLDSCLHKAKPVALKLGSCPFFSEQDQIVNLKASTLQVDRRKMTDSTLMDFVLIAILRSKQWAAFVTFVTVKKNFTLSLETILRTVARKGRSTNGDEVEKKRKRFHCSWIVSVWMV